MAAYKPDQGRMARMASFWTIAAMVFYGCSSLRAELPGYFPKLGQPLMAGLPSIPILGVRLDAAFLIALEANKMGLLTSLSAWLGGAASRNLTVILRALALACFGAIYLLHPEGSQAGRRIIREKLPSAPAALSLVANFKLARMMGPAEMPEVLRRASVIADGVPVYRLSLPRDFSALPAVVETIRAWHDPDVAPGLSRASA